MLYSQLSTTDKHLIEYYITHYANESNGTKYTPLKTPLETVLSAWSEEKQYLYRDLANNLIVSKEVEVAHDEESMCNRFRLSKIFCKFLSHLSGKFYEMYNANELTFAPIEGLSNTSLYHFISRQLDGYDYQKFIDNKIGSNAYRHNTIKIKVNSTGKTYTFVEGEKIMKVIKRVVDIVNDEWCNEHYDEFRIFHSQVLNEKTLKGTLCLSIHPLDFMTMSHNALNWRSCMYWDNEGCYKSGTIEMMNSDNVIIAYLKSNKDMDIGDGNKWNNKKWRCLFVIEDDIIFSVKGYPYQNEELTSLAGKLIAETINNARGKEIYRLETETYEHFDFYDEDADIRTASRIVRSFETEKMYNDIHEWEGKHWYITNYDAENALDDRHVYHSEVEYSGPSTCVLCGQHNYCEDEVDLLCESCRSGYHRCENCHSFIEEGEGIYNSNTNGYICQECHDTKYFHDPLDDTLQYLGSGYQLRVIRQNEENKWFEVGTIHISYHTYNRLFDFKDSEILWFKYFNKVPLLMTYPYYCQDYAVMEEDFTALGKEVFKFKLHDTPQSLSESIRSVERKEIF